MQHTIQHTVTIGKKIFQIWNESGKVRQNGSIALPHYLAEYEDSRAGRLQAGAYISGFLEAIRIANRS